MLFYFDPATDRYIQGVSGGIVNILGGGSMDYVSSYKCVQFFMGVETQLFECYA
jgi:hypothetical protein